MIRPGSLHRSLSTLLVGLLVVLAGLPAAVGQQALSPLESAGKDDAPPPARNARNKEDLEFYVRHLYIWGAQIQIEIGDFEPTAIEGLLQTKIRASYKLNSKEVVLYVSKDGEHVFEGRTYDVDKNPFHDTIEKITTIDQPSFGTPGAPVVIAVYSDFQCPYCAKEAKILRKQVAEAYPEQVRVYFRDFPLKNHNWAKNAAIAGRCIYGMEPETFWDYHDWIFENQKSVTVKNVTEKVMEFAHGKQLDSLKLSSCIEKRETEPEVDESIEEGFAVGVASTPTIFVNGRRLAGSLDWKHLKSIIDYEIDYQKIAKNAGDDCGCEVALPFPGVE